MISSDHLKGEIDKIKALLFMVKIERTLKNASFYHPRGMKWFILVMLTRIILSSS